MGRIAGAGLAGTALLSEGRRAGGAAGTPRCPGGGSPARGCRPVPARPCGQSPPSQGLAVGQRLERVTVLTGSKGPYNCSSLVFSELLCKMWMYGDDCGAWLLYFTRVDGY